MITEIMTSLERSDGPNFLHAKACRLQACGVFASSFLYVLVTGICTGIGSGGHPPKSSAPPRRVDPPSTRARGTAATGGGSTPPGSATAPGGGKPRRHHPQSHRAEHTTADTTGSPRNQHTLIQSSQNDCRDGMIQSSETLEP
jgi:hypothetical protein